MRDVANAEGLVIDDKQAALFRVNRAAFTDPDILALERERIFDRSWLFAGHVSEARNPGDFVTRNVGGRPVIIVRGDDDEVRVLLNTCRHRGNLVCRDACGTGAEVLRCFYHGWVFSTRGELIGVPGAESYSDAFDRGALGLEPAPRMENYRGCLFISFDPGIESFVDYMGEEGKFVFDNTLDLGELEVVGGQQLYSMKANWKLLVENSMDGYHFGVTHERYQDYLVHMGAVESGQPRVNRGPGRVRALGNGHTTTGYPIARTGPRSPNYLGKVAEAQLDVYLTQLEMRFPREKALRVEEGSGNSLIFPNLITIDSWRTFRTFYPITPDYMEISAWALMPKEDTPEMRALRIDNFLSFLGPGGFGTPDDVEALEGCQRAFATQREVQWSDISRGMAREIPGNADELQMRTFWREWYARMTTGRHAQEPGDR